MDPTPTPRPYGEVYCIRCLVTGKLYVGQTTKGIEARWKDHQIRAGKARWAISRALARYGAENFCVWVIDSANSQEELEDKEILWIKKLGCRAPNGYNLTPGGTGRKAGTPLTEEHKARIARSHIGLTPSLETRMKISAKAKGRKATPETRAKMAASRTGRAVPEETKARIAAANTGKVHTPEARAKMQGRKVSLESRARMAEAARNRRKANVS
jgi:group I intron endonuclease